METSEINGSGHGSKHNWKRGDTEQVNSVYGYTGGTKSTFYSCRNCGVSFRHNYDQIEDIFIAMAVAGVPCECKTT